MLMTVPHLSFAFACLALFMLVQASLAETEDLGNGFLNHGVATAASNHRGTVATVDGDDRDVVLVWLFDSRGGYALLAIDALTGESHEYEMPFPPGGDCPYSSILSSKNKFYTHFNSHFVEFDPVKREFTFFQKTTPQMAMGMTEDDNGVIWSVSYPNSGVVSYDPQTGEFKDYGTVHDENWRQYQRYVAADDTGWVYFGIGSTNSHLIGFDPKAETAKPMIPESERGGEGTAGFVYRATDGKVYGQAVSGKDRPWYELYAGETRKLESFERVAQKPIITSHQGLFHRDFPSGRKLVSCDLVSCILTTQEPDGGEQKSVKFEYQREGAHVMGVAAAPDGTICGGTAFPMRFFSYDPKTDKWQNWAAYGQCNTVVSQGDRFFVGGYGGGYLTEWDPTAPWVATVKDKEGCNPLFLTDTTPTINRPHDLLAHPDGKTIVLAGTPGYGFTGGGLLFWDRETKTRVLLGHTDILPNHSTMSLVALPDGKLLGGSTTSPGTGGEKLADQAELYIMDMATKQVEWHEPLFPGAQTYTDLCPAPNGLVYGVVDGRTFFVFDPATRQLIHQEDTTGTVGGSSGGQGPRVFVPAPDGTIYMLYSRYIVTVDPETFELRVVTQSPVSIGVGGDMVDGRIYFATGAYVYSYGVTGDR